MPDITELSQEDKDFVYHIRTEILAEREPSEEDITRALLLISKGLNSRELSARSKTAQASRAVINNKPTANVEDLFKLPEL